MIMLVPEFKSCCCCCVSLRTGSKIFGFISLVACLFVVITTCVEFAVSGKHALHYKDTLIVVDIIAHATQMVSSFVLLLGVYHEKASLIPWWLFTTPIIAVLELLLLPSFFWRFVQLPYFKFDLSVFAINLLLLGDDVYGWLVVFNYNRTLKMSHCEYL